MTHLSTPARKHTGTKILLQMCLIAVAIQLNSCSKEETPLEPPVPVPEVWLHRVNTTEKAALFRNKYSGFELDVHFDTVRETFLVKHDFADTTTLTLSDWLVALQQPQELGLWLDFKNLTEETAHASATELLRIRNTFQLTHRPLIVEASNPVCLLPFDTLNLIPSFYIPTFDPGGISPEEELAYRDYIAGYLEQTGVGTLSGYYNQHPFMQQWFPLANKLLWYLESTDPEKKAEVIRETMKDPRVQVLLVAEEQP